MICNYSSRKTELKSLLTAWCASLAGQGDHPLLCVQSAWAGARSASSTQGPALTHVHSSCHPSSLSIHPLTLRATQAKVGAQAWRARVIIYCCVLQGAWAGARSLSSTQGPALTHDPSPCNLPCLQDLLRTCKHSKIAARA